MALELKFYFKDSFDGLSQVFSEFTSAYNASTDLGGYGSPNPTTGSLTYTELKIQMRGESTVYTVTPITGFPSDKTNPPDTFPVPYTSFGGKRDGIFHITYSVGTSSSNIVASNDYYFAFIPNIRCCMRKLRQGMKISKGCGCKDEKWESMLNNWALVESLCGVLICENLDEVQEVIDYLKQFATCKGCGQ